MPATVRTVPPGGLPGELLVPHRRRSGTVYMGQSASDLADTNSDSPTVQAWTAGIKAAGRVATRFPYTGPLHGLLASRLPVKDPTKGWDYQLAPNDVLAADSWTSFQSYLTIQAGDVAAALESASKAVLGAPGDLLSYVTGLPKWVLVGAGLLVLYGVAVAIIPRYLPAPRRGR